jgi:hypothetical protein
MTGPQFIHIISAPKCNESCYMFIVADGTEKLINKIM